MKGVTKSLLEGNSLNALILNDIFALGVGGRFTSKEIADRITTEDRVITSRAVAGALRMYNGYYFKVVGESKHKHHIYEVTKVVS